MSITTDTLPPSCLRVLLAVLRMSQRGERLTVRSVQRAAGRAFGTVHTALHRLRSAGLVSWDEGTIAGRYATLRPCCRMEVYEEALPRA